jgi:hypothetical protein
MRDESAAPAAAARCWTADWADMKRARSAGSGTMEAREAAGLD